MSRKYLNLFNETIFCQIDFGIIQNLLVRFIVNFLKISVPEKSFEYHILNLNQTTHTHVHARTHAHINYAYYQRNFQYNYSELVIDR